MSEKYIDLAERIKRGHGDDEVCEGIDYALRWLDEHPDRVPGRTITRSEIDNHIAIDITMRNGFILGFEAAGGRVIPDPEPTNAEKLEAALLDTFGLLEVLGNQGVHNLAFNLDKAGVKAPGTNDDQ